MKICFPTRSAGQRSPTPPESSPALPDVGSTRLPRGMALAAAGTALGVSGAVTAAAAGKGPLDPELYRHLLARDRPFNTLPIVVVHNAGSEPGSGSWPLLAQSQSASISRTLERTPVRGFELDLHLRHGVLVVNHGGLYDGRVARPLELGPVARGLDAWLDAPANRGEVIYLVIESHLSPADNDRAFDALREVFGERLYTPAEHASFVAEAGRFPTVAELALDGPRVLVVSDRLGDKAEVPFPKKLLAAFAAHVWEDRTLIGRLGAHVNAEIPSPLDTARVDALVHSGGIIKLDQLDRVARRAGRQVLGRGLASSAQSSLLVGAAGLLFPASTGFVFAAAVGLFLLGAAASAVAAVIRACGPPRSSCARSVGACRSRA